MSEIIVVEILVSLGFVSFVSYFVFISLHKKRKLDRANEQKMETIRIEKELDKSDAIKRDLKLVLTDKKAS
jgi:hypothetical protein